MKLKQHPEDFRVEELTDRVPGNVGPFGFYRLDKRGWDTLDALQAIRRRWRIEFRRISYGGLKDRHAETVQYFTILHGPKRNLTHHGVKVSYCGQVLEPYSSRDVRANGFRITLRDLQPREIAVSQEDLEEVRTQGVPNYFDDQRFGSVSEPGLFVARSMVLGRYEEALRLALAASYAHDQAAQKEEKAILSTHWGDWKTCKGLLPRGHARSLVDYLVGHPADFRGAVSRLRPDLLSLYLSAYQSHLWNRLLVCYIQRLCSPEQIVLARFRLGELPMHRRLTEAQFTELSRLQLPLPSARLKMAPSDSRRALVEAVLSEEGPQLNDLKLKGLRKPFFSKGERPALYLPRDLGYEASPDERHPQRSKLLLSFELPRGSYATLIVKRIQAGCEDEG
jgi:tRNA pseudouridine13 synthase